MTSPQKKRMKSHSERVRQQIVSGVLSDQVCTQHVFRQPEVTDAIRGLEEVVQKQLVRAYTIPGLPEDVKSQVVVPLVDLEALFSYLISDLSLFVQGGGDVRTMARSFFETEVFDQDEDFDKELYHGVLDEVVRVVNFLVQQLRTTDFDHHAHHTYDLVRILPSRGLLLVRAAYCS